MTGVKYPALYDYFISLIDLVNLNLGYILSLACILETDYHDRLLFATIGPMILLTALAGLYVIARSRNKHSPKALREVKRRYASVVLFVLFLVYSSISHTIFQAFVPHKLDNGIQYLRADYRVIYDSGEHRAFMVYAAAMAIVYPIGIPATFAWWLWRHRDVLMAMPRKGEDPEEVRILRDLWEPYKPRRFYYEILEYLRRVSLTGISAFIYPGSAAQVSIVFLIAVFFTLLFEMLSPFAKPLDAWLYRSGNCLVLVSMYMALLLKVDVSRDDSGSQEVFSSLLIGLHVGLVCVAVLQPLLWPSKGTQMAAPVVPRTVSVSTAGTTKTGKKTNTMGGAEPIPHDGSEVDR